jgi:hypothetical protein
MTRSLIGLAAVLFVAVGTAGCTEAPAPVSLGHVAIPLTAPGAGGTTYRLPPNTFLFLSGAGFFGRFSLDDDAPSLTVDVPPGDYSVFLSFDGDTTTWPLRRQNADGTIQTVPGTLDLTSTITVTENQTTSLVIRFHVAGIVPITFSFGSVDVTVAVDETAASSFDFELAAPAFTVASAVFSDTAPAELASRLPATDSTGDRYVLHAQTTSPWSLVGPNFVCADASISIDAGGNQGFIDMVTEAPPSGTEQLCIVQSAPQFAQIFTTVLHEGTATTPLLSDLGDRQYSIVHSLSGFIEADVLDGKTLHLEVLAGTHTASMHLFAEIVAEIPNADGGITFDVWYLLNANDNSEGTTTLTVP